MLKIHKAINTETKPRFSNLTALEIKNENSKEPKKTSIISAIGNGVFLFNRLLNKSMDVISIVTVIDNP